MPLCLHPPLPTGHGVDQCADLRGLEHVLAGSGDVGLVMKDNDARRRRQSGCEDPVSCAQESRGAGAAEEASPLLVLVPTADRRSLAS